VEAAARWFNVLETRLIESRDKHLGRFTMILFRGKLVVETTVDVYFREGSRLWPEESDLGENSPLRAADEALK